MAKKLTEEELQKWLGRYDNRIRNFKIFLGRYGLHLVKVRKGWRQYRVKNKRGSVIAGRKEAMSADELYQWFIDKGGFPLEIRNEPEEHKSLDHNRELFTFVYMLGDIRPEYKIDVPAGYVITPFGYLINLFPLSSLKRELTGPYFLDHKPDANGYMVLHTTIDGKDYHFSLHRLTAEAFCPNHLGKKFVHHLDINPLNNYFVNLLWVTDPEHKELHRLWKTDRKKYWKRVCEIYNDNCNGKRCGYGSLHG